MQNKKPKTKIVFDYTATWYLVLNNSLSKYEPGETFPSPLFEGNILHDKKPFSKGREYRLGSRLLVTDFIGIFNKLSEPFVFPVRVEKKTRVKPEGNNTWFVGSVTLLKPLNVWEYFSLTGEDFTGTINLNGQPYLPQGLIFPKVLKGDLIINYAALPSEITLPDIIEGAFKIQLCHIPPTWKFPGKIKNLELVSCDFFNNIDFNKIEVSEIQIEGCYHPPFIPFPVIYPGKLSLGMDMITSAFQFPSQVGDLSFHEMSIEKEIKLPQIITGSLTMVEVEIHPGVTLPWNCKSFTALECKFPEDFKLPRKGLEEIELIYCTLHEGFILPKFPFKRLAFESMIIPAGFKLPGNFTGSLEFNQCQMPARFKLPKSITGTLQITQCEISGKLRLPAKGEYAFFVHEEDDFANMSIPASIESRIKRISYKEDSDEMSDDSLLI